jgi:hypothetical protein
MLEFLQGRRIYVTLNARCSSRQASPDQTGIDEKDPHKDDHDHDQPGQPPLGTFHSPLKTEQQRQTHPRAPDYRASSHPAER